MTQAIARARRFLPWLLLLAAVGAAAYFLVLRPVDVRARRARVSTVVVEALGTGSVESRRTIDVSFEVTGRVTAIRVDQGDVVREGQELASIDDTTFATELALAQQEIALARSTVQRLEADVERAQAVLKGAQDGLERVSSVAETGAVSAEAIDVAEERERVAAAELARAEAARLEGLEAVLAAELRRDTAQTRLERTTVRSPFEGLVVRRAREVGDVAVPGSAVLELAATDTVWASVWVDETYLPSLSPGLPARIALRSEPERTVGGTVSRIGREVDRETRELLVDVSFEQRPERLVLGQRVDLWIELARHESVLTVPSGLVVRVDGREGVFVKDGARARLRPVVIGARGRSVVEITDGIGREDLLLSPADGGRGPLGDGQRVRVVGDPDEDVE